MLKKRISLIALVIVGAFILFGIYVWNNISSSSTSYDGFTSVIDGPESDGPESDTAFGGIFSSPHIDDSLPYYKYRQILDSFTQAKQRRESKNKGSGLAGFSSGGIGVYSVQKKSSYELPFLPFVTETDPVIRAFIDSLNKMHPNPSEQQLNDDLSEIDKKMNEGVRNRMDSVNKELGKERLYYFALSGYELKDYNSQFYIKDDTYNLVYVKFDTLIKRKYDSTERGHFESKQIKVRYASNYKAILIPVTKTTHTILNYIIWVFAFITGAIIIYFFMGLPIQILINISKGKAFTEKNIYMLKQISWVALIISILTIISPYIFRLICWKMIPEDFVLQPFINRIIQNLPVLFMVLVTFLIAKAFKKGYKLQQYEDLTI